MSRRLRKSPTSSPGCVTTRTSSVTLPGVPCEKRKASVELRVPGVREEKRARATTSRDAVLRNSKVSASPSAPVSHHAGPVLPTTGESLAVQPRLPSVMRSGTGVNVVLQMAEEEGGCQRNSLRIRACCRPNRLWSPGLGGPRAHPTSSCRHRQLQDPAHFCSQGCHVGRHHGSHNHHLQGGSQWDHPQQSRSRSAVAAR